MGSAQQRDIDGFAPRQYASGRDVMRYRLFIPKSYDPQQKYPIVIWLHGAGGVGVDNVRQLSNDQVPGTRLWSDPSNQAKHPAFVLVPQSSIGWGAQPKSRQADVLSGQLKLVVGILDLLANEFSLDPARVYVAGQSDGGYAVWEIVTSRPERFAAAIALCGGGTPEKAARLVNMPLWVFHGSDDKTIPVSESRNMVKAIQKAGGNPRYTEYKGAGHDIWSRAFAEPELVEWLFAQRKP